MDIRKIFTRMLERNKDVPDTPKRVFERVEQWLSILSDSLKPKIVLAIKTGDFSENMALVSDTLQQFRSDLNYLQQQVPLDTFQEFISSFQEFEGQLLHHLKIRQYSQSLKDLTALLKSATWLTHEFSKRV